MAKTQSNEAISALRGHLRIIAGRQISDFNASDLTSPDEAELPREDMAVVFAVPQILGVEKSLNEAETIAADVAAKDLAANLLAGRTLKRELQTALQLARDTLGDSARLAASHFRNGSFRSALAIADEAFALLERDAAPELLKVAAALAVPSPKRSMVEIADEAMCQELHKNFKAHDWSLREWEAATGFDKDTIAKTLTWASLREVREAQEQSARDVAYKASEPVMPRRGQRRKASTDRIVTRTRTKSKKRHTAEVCEEAASPGE